MNIAIVGASGAVGQELLRILAERQFPITSLRLFGSARSAGTTYTFCGKEYTVELLQHGDLFQGIDIAFVSAGGSVSKEYAEDIASLTYNNLDQFNVDKYIEKPRATKFLEEFNKSIEKFSHKVNSTVDKIIDEFGK